MRDEQDRRDGKTGARDTSVVPQTVDDDTSADEDAPDRGWPRFFAQIFNDPKRFRRFMLMILVMLGFLLAAGWLWGAAATGAAAAGAGVLRWLTKRLGA